MTVWIMYWQIFKEDDGPHEAFPPRVFATKDAAIAAAERIWAHSTPDEWGEFMAENGKLGYTAIMFDIGNPEFQRWVAITEAEVEQ